MEGVGLSNAQMNGADLTGAQMEGADLLNAQMEGAKLGEAQMEGAILFGAQMKSAHWWHTTRTLGALAHSADLTDGILGQAQLDGMIGDATTRLDDGLSIPGCWPDGHPGIALAMTSLERHRIALFDLTPWDEAKMREAGYICPEGVTEPPRYGPGVSPSE